MNDVDALLVDGDYEVLGEARVRALAGLEEGGAVGGPAVDDLEEGDLGLVRAHARVLVVGAGDLLLPLVAGLRLQQVCRHQALQHTGYVRLGLRELQVLLIDEGNVPQKTETMQKKLSYRCRRKI